MFCVYQTINYKKSNSGCGESPAVANRITLGNKLSSRHYSVASKDSKQSIFAPNGP